MNTSIKSEEHTSVLNFFNIIRVLGEQKNIGLTELSKRLAISKSTTYRFLQTMKSIGLVDQVGESDKYALTIKLFQLGSNVIGNINFHKCVNKEMREVSRAVNETVLFGIRYNNEVTYLHKIDSSYHLRINYKVGNCESLHSTAIGKVLLSQLTNDEVQEYLSSIDFAKYMSSNYFDIELFTKELHQIKTLHYGEEVVESGIGLRSIAVPVYDSFGKPIAALSLCFPVFRFCEERKSEYLYFLWNAARNISKNLGCQDYPI